jgi:hypothetical protein
MLAYRVNIIIVEHEKEIAVQLFIFLQIFKEGVLELNGIFENLFQVSLDMIDDDPVVATVIDDLDLFHGAPPRLTFN